MTLPNQPRRTSGRNILLILSERIIPPTPVETKYRIIPNGDRRIIPDGDIRIVNS